MSFRITLLKTILLRNSDDLDFEIIKRKVFDFNKQVTVNFLCNCSLFKKRIIITTLCADSTSC